MAVEGVGAFGQESEVAVTVGETGIEHQDVVPTAAVELVEAVLAFQPVGVGTAPENIVAAVAVEQVFAAVAEELVIGTHARQVRILAIVRSHRPVAVEVVVARLAHQHVLADIPVEEIAAGTAEELVAYQAGLVDLAA